MCVCECVRRVVEAMLTRGSGAPCNPTRNAFLPIRTYAAASISEDRINVSFSCILPCCPSCFFVFAYVSGVISRSLSRMSSLIFARATFS